MANRFGSFLRNVGSALDPGAFQAVQQQNLAMAQGENQKKSMMAKILASALAVEQDPDRRAEYQGALDKLGFGELGVIKGTEKEKNLLTKPAAKDFTSESLRVFQQTGNQADLVPREKTPTTIINTQEKFLSKVMQKRIEDIDEQGASGLQTMRHMGELQHLLGQGLDTGRFEEFKLEAGKVFEAAGMGTLAKRISDVPNAEAFRKIAGTTVLEGLKQFKLFPVSNVDLREVKSVFANLTTTNEANAFSIRALKEGAFGSVMKKRVADEALAASDTPGDVQRQINKWTKVFESPRFRRFATAPNGKPIWFNEYYEHKLQQDPTLSFTDITNQWIKQTR